MSTGSRRGTELLQSRECGVTWRANELLGDVASTAPLVARRDALARAGAWLGSLPPRLALEQEDAVRAVAERCGYSVEAVQRAFRARFFRDPTLRAIEADAGNTARRADHDIDL